ncbi:efflux RND transporter periplasmic adaptor subunit [bacterium]|nr:efflux RND transporter periplasmic adaptor subunit [bacterium]
MKLLTLMLLLALVGAGCGKKDDDDHAGHDHAGPAHGQAKAATAAKCPHDAPKELCFICDPVLREKGRLWCKGHERYEDRCWLCRPELEDKQRLWCKEHSLYEDECFLCDPSRKKTAQTAPAARLMCHEHNVPEGECGICHPELAGKLPPGASVQVRLPATESARWAGVETATPTVGAMADAIECYAEFAYDQNKLAQIAALVGGIIQEVDVDLGSRVAEKQTVAKIWSAAIAKAVAEAVLTHQTLDRERKLHADRISSEKDVQEAEAAHRAACQQARAYGFTEDHIEAIRRAPVEVAMLEVRAPFAGEIIERTAVRGAQVEAGKSLFTLADRSTMWAMLNIPEAALARVQVGQAVEVRVDSLPGKLFAGKLTWISSEVNDRTRMARARAEVPNPDGALRANMFAQARILTRQTDKALLLPTSAIQRVEGNALVFVQKADDLFEARAVRLGAKFNGHQEIREGLQPEEVVVVRHVFALKSQLLISRLGAGCADD